MEVATDSAGHDIVVVGASAGGVEALRSIVSFLPSDLAASVFVVLHVPPGGVSVLPKILARAGPLRAVHASDCEAIEQRCIYIAPPDQHMRFSDAMIRLDRGPKEHGHRPAVDSLFYSAAETYGGRVTGVILSGVLDDGAAGLFAVARSGGAPLIQSAADALYSTMPEAALDVVDGAFVGNAEELALQIISLSRTPPTRPAPAVEVMQEERRAEVARGATDDPQPGEPTGFTCPECHGSLWETGEGGAPRFRCRTGHEFSAETLFVEQSEHVERALWAALRALEEKGAMLHRMAARSRDRGHHSTSHRLGRKADAAVEEAIVIRSLIAELEPIEPAAAAEGR
jgi:two-component system chemotaxis response regulator CheB